MLKNTTYSILGHSLHTANVMLTSLQQ